MYHMLDCLTKIKQLNSIWLIGMMLKEQLQQSNIHPVRSLFTFHLPFVTYIWNAEPCDQFLISIYGCGNGEIGC